MRTLFNITITTIIFIAFMGYADSPTNYHAKWLAVITALGAGALILNHKK